MLNGVKGKGKTYVTNMSALKSKCIIDSPIVKKVKEENNDTETHVIPVSMLIYLSDSLA